MAAVPRRSLIAGSAVGTVGLALALPNERRATAQSAWESLRIETIGWSAAGTSVSVGLIISNPNTGVGMGEIELEIAGYDASGTVLKTTSDYVTWLAPGQRTGISSDLFLSAGQTVDRVEASVKRESFRPMDGIPVEGVRYVEERFSSAVTGTVRNPYPRALESLQVSSLWYDSGGNLIGGNDTSIQSVPANGTASARVSVPDNVKPARVEMYAGLSILTKFR